MHPGTDDPGTDDLMTDALMTDDLAPLREALGDLLTARRNAAGLTQRQLAHRVNYARSTVGGAEGGHRVPAESFWKRCDQLLGAGGGELLRAYHQLAAARTGNKQRRDRLEQARREARYGDVLQDGALLPSLVERLDATDGAGVAVPRRPSPAARVFGDLIGAAVPTPAADPDTVDVTEALLRHGSLAAGSAREDSPGLDALGRSVAAAKTAYQAARHARAARMLPALLDGLRSATTFLSGDAQRAAWALTAETYHVAASIQLKAGKEGPAWLAADRSASAAERSGDPVMAVSSARIVAHVLTAGGDHARATALAQRVASSAVLPTSNAAVSVYGAAAAARCRRRRPRRGPSRRGRPAGGSGGRQPTTGR